MQARYVHTNLVARDFERLATFYERVFGCVRVGPLRDLSGPEIDLATGLSGARIRGVHLRLPPGGEPAPTLEIFEYQPRAESPAPTIHRPGFGHIAFVVDDVHALRRELLAAGGGDLGQVVSIDVAGAGRLTFAYLTDPEGNIVEVQRWE